MEIPKAIISIANERNIRYNYILVQRWLYLISGFCLLDINKSILGKGVWHAGRFAPHYPPLLKHNLKLPEPSNYNQVKYGIVDIINRVLDQYGNKNHIELTRLIAHCNSPWDIVCVPLNEKLKMFIDLEEEDLVIPDKLIKKQFETNYGLILL